MHDAVRTLAERGNINHLDALLVWTWASQKEIHDALHSASVWELRDRIIHKVHIYTSQRIKDNAA